MSIRIRKKDSENLSDTQLKNVFNLLNADSPITKKRACELLNITYNTTRLNNIMQDYVDKRDFAIKRRNSLRNTPITKGDITYIISSYLEGISILDISKGIFRSSGIVKRTLEKYNIPLRNSKVSFFNPIFLSENSISETYTKDDLVYSARYNQPAKISKLYNKDEKIYRIWLSYDMQYVYQPYYELADLTKVQKKFNIDIQDMKWLEDIQPVIIKTLNEASKKKGKHK